MAQSDRTATSTTADCPASPFPHSLLFLELPPPLLLTSTTSPSPRHDRMKLTSRFPHFFRTPPSIRSLATHTLLFLPTRTTFLGGRCRQAPLASPSIYFPSHIDLVDIALTHPQPPPSPHPDDAGITASFFLHCFPAFASVASCSQCPYLAST